MKVAVQRTCTALGRTRQLNSSLLRPSHNFFNQRRYRSSSTLKDGRPLRAAIIGSGPAGFYTARKLLSDLPNVSIDMYEQLPVPFGLVRFGVAPDHPEVKVLPPCHDWVSSKLTTLAQNCQDTFTEVAQDKRFNFIGNVNLGYDLPLPLLARHHQAIIFAYGASKDRELGLEDEDNIQNIYSARAFVGWYNGLPQYRDLNPDLTAGEDAVIIGQGNVALDVARTLLTDVDILRKTDITSWALERLAESRVKNVRIVGRRGPVQAAFTIKEIRELMQLPDTHFRPIPPDLFPSDIASLPRPQKRILQLLQKGSPTGPGATKSWSLDFLLSPQSLSSSLESSDISHKTSIKRLTGVNFIRNTLADPFSPTSSLLPSDENSAKVHMPTSTLFRSIGYQSEPLPGFDELGIAFDKRKGTIKNDGLGRVLSDHAKQGNPCPVPGLYCAGWVKRGPTGVIASTMNDAFSTAESVAADLADGRPFLQGTGQGWKGCKVDAGLYGVESGIVNWPQWETIDSVEKDRGTQQGRVRDKLGTVDEMLAVARP